MRSHNPSPFLHRYKSQTRAADGPVSVQVPEQRTHESLSRESYRERQAQPSQYIELEQPLTGTPQNYYLGLTGGEGELTYFLNSYELEAGRGCIDEVIEPNNTADQATPLRIGERRSGYELCPDERDIDVFSIELEAGQTLDLTMFYNTGEADMYMDLYEPSAADEMVDDLDGFLAVERSTISAEGDNLSFTARECGVHYIRVQTRQTAVPFDMLAEVTSPTCEDVDEFSEQCNHAMASPASGLIISFVDRLELCGESSDWYEWYGGFSNVIIELRAIEGDDTSTADITIELWDPSGEVMLASSVVADEGGEDEHLELEYIFPDNEIYLLHVRSDRSEKLIYELELIDQGAPF